MALIPCPLCKMVGTIDISKACWECYGYTLVQDKDGSFVPCPNSMCKDGQVKFDGIVCPLCEGKLYVTK